MSNNNRPKVSEKTFGLEMSEELLGRLGSTWLIDSIHLFVIPPLSVLGFFLNLSCFFALWSRPGKVKLCKYLMVYALNSATLSLIHAFTFVSFSPRYFPTLSFSYAAKFYRCRVLAYVSVSLCFLGNLLDIIIALDRIALFLNEALHSISSMRPYTKCFLILAFSFLVNAPILFSLKVIDNSRLFDANAIHFCARTEFARSKEGLVTNIVLVSFRDMITLVAELVLTCFSLHFYIKYNTISIQNRYRSVNLSNLSLGRLKSSQRAKEKQILLISIYLTSMSIVFHLILFTVMFIVSSVSGPDPLRTAIFILFLIFSIVTKNFLNVLIFYKFNKLFKQQFRLSSLVFSFQIE